MLANDAPDAPEAVEDTPVEDGASNETPLDDQAIPAATAVDAAVTEEAPVFSPFGRRSAPMDDWLRLTIYGLVAAIVLVVGFLAWSYYSDVQRARTQSLTGRAVANLAVAVKSDPSNPQARVKLAEALLADGQTDAAVDQLTQALQIDEKNIDALTDLGLIAMDRKQYSDAEKYWLKVIPILRGNEMSDQDQRLANAYYYMGTTLMELKRYEEAAAALKSSITIKRDSSPVHYMLSVAYQRLGLEDMQREELGIVLAFDPREAQANYDLGMLDLKAGQEATAAELFRVSADNAPAGITAPRDELAKLGEASLRLDTARSLQNTDPQGAVNQARIASAIEPANVEAVRLIAQLWEKLGNKSRAMNAWQRLLELVPGDPKATEAIKRLS